MGHSSRLRSEAGFTIVEVVVAASLLVVGLLAVAGMFDLSKRTTVDTRARVIGTNIGRELVEAARGIPYAEISDASVLTRLAGTEPWLADSEPGLPYTVERRGTVYTITAETCVVDDARDGTGASPRPGDFCPDSAPVGIPDPRSGRADRVPEDYKRVDVKVAWTRSGRANNVRQSTLVNNPGSAGAPAIVSLTAQGVGNPPVVGPTRLEGLASTPSITFDVTTSSQPHALKWLLDGVAQAVVCSPCSGKAFTFTWNLDSPTVATDGPYLVSAEAYDVRSVAGPSRSTTIILNRRHPKAPTGVAGGRNHISGTGDVVEIEWLPSPERDLTGYDVIRLDSSGPVTICARQMATTCTDPSPPDASTVRYLVRAWDVDMNGVTPRPSPYFATLDVIKDNKVPNKPDNVVKVVNADGTVSIRWSKPSPEDPDTGDRIAFFRIYRDDTKVGNRYGRVDAAGTTAHEFVDNNPSGNRRYWVVAVDTRYAESGFVEAKVP